MEKSARVDIEARFEIPVSIVLSVAAILPVVGL